MTSGLAWLVHVVVIADMGYLVFVMALAGWFAGMRRGEAVTLLPEQHTQIRTVWLQVAIVAISLGVTAGLIYVLWIPVPLRLASGVSVTIAPIGLALFILGTLLIVWARRCLGRMWGISTSREVRLLPDHRLMKDGPYSVIRHPMYAGWWLALLGMILIYRTWVLIFLLLFSVVVFARRARLEERTLATRFGGEWHEYAASTRSLIPFIC